MFLTALSSSRMTTAFSSISPGRQRGMVNRLPQFFTPGVLFSSLFSPAGAPGSPGFAPASDDFAELYFDFTFLDELHDYVVFSPF